MALRSLLFCRDALSLTLLRRLLEDIAVGVESCHATNDALQRVRQSKYEAVLLDVDIEGARDILAAIRQAPYNRSSIVFAMTRRVAAVREVFAGGANFVLDKPLAADRTARCLRAAQALLLREHRRSYRHGIDTTVMLQAGRGAETRARAIDLSEGGMMVFLEHSAVLGNNVRFRFPLPDRPLWMEGRAEVTSVAASRVGLRFVGLSRRLQLELAHWLNERIDLPGLPAPARGHSDSPVPGS